MDNFSLFDFDDDEYTGPVLTAEMISNAERSLGLKLPGSYLECLNIRNGGSLLRVRFDTPFSTSWAEDHFEIRAILGVGFSGGVDDAEFGSQYLVEEWGYPKIGLVVCETPSGGHDTVMLDYSFCSDSGEPAVVYVDEDRTPRRVASSWGGFIAKLIVQPDE